MTIRNYMVALIGATSAFACSAQDGPERADDLGAEIDTLEQGIRKGLPGAQNGQGDYCHPTARCEIGEGDCDSDTDCVAGLVCGTDNGAPYGLRPTVDVCEESHCTNGIQDDAAGETGVDCGGPCIPCENPGTPGTGGYCTVTYPCSHSFGDCNNDTHCLPGLTCVHDVGGQYGYHKLIDVCVTDHCANGVLDEAEGETGVDCGGPCAPCDPGGSGTLIITEIADYETNTNIKYVELYNASGGPLNLSDFTVHSYLTTSTTPTRSQTLPSVMLAANTAYVIVKSSGAGAYQSTFGIAPDVTSAIPNGNGDDVYSLTQGGTLVDIYGEIGVSGVGQAWYYSKSIAKRNVGVDAGSGVWQASEWTITTGTAQANPGVRN